MEVILFLNSNPTQFRGNSYESLFLFPTKLIPEIIIIVSFMCVCAFCIQLFNRYNIHGFVLLHSEQYYWIYLIHRVRIVICIQYNIINKTFFSVYEKANMIIN